MKYYTALLLTCMLTCCAGEDEPLSDNLNLNLVDINTMTATTTEPSFEVILQHTDGSAVAEEALTPSTNYQLAFNSEEPMNYYIRITDGFEVQINNEGSFPDRKKIMPIITNAEIPRLLYVGLIPIVVNENQYNRTPPKGFLLP